MEKEFEEKYHTLEDGHYWFRARRHIIARLLRFTPKTAKIIDIGCSGCAMLADLASAGFSHLFGLDVSETAIGICQKRGFQSTHVADGASTGYGPGAFEVAIASDILEHMQEDAAAIREWARILNKDGTLIIFVPAHRYLWSKHDAANQHFRRYRKNELKSVVEENGFYIERIGYWNFCLFFPVLFTRGIQRLLVRQSVVSGADNLYRVNPTLNKVLFSLLALENKLMALGIQMPIGVSLFCIAKKK